MFSVLKRPGSSTPRRLWSRTGFMLESRHLSWLSGVVTLQWFETPQSRESLEYCRTLPASNPRSRVVPVVLEVEWNLGEGRVWRLKWGREIYWIKFRFFPLKKLELVVPRQFLSFYYFWKHVIIFSVLFIILIIILVIVIIILQHKFGLFSCIIIIIIII
jgi:hypothetical protein